MAWKLVRTGCNKYEWIEVPDEEIVPERIPVEEPIRQPEYV